MNMKQIRASLFLLITAAIWGMAFVALRSGLQYIGPFTFNGVRFLIGTASVLPLLAFFREKPPQDADGRAARRRDNGRVVWASLIVGTTLFAATMLQQLGLMGTPSGKGAFISSLNVVLVPIFGLFLKQYTRINVWIGAALSVAGLYFLCAGGNLAFSPYDLMLLGCAAFFAIHILLINHFAVRLHWLKLAIGQYLTCGLWSLAVAAFREPITWTGITQAVFPLLYCGVCSIAVAFTLQIIGQKDASPASAAIILSCQSLFAMLFGFLLLDERMSGRELVGVAFMLIGIVLSQITLRRREPDLP